MTAAVMTAAMCQQLTTNSCLYETDNDSWITDGSAADDCDDEGILSELTMNDRPSGHAGEL